MVQADFAINPGTVQTTATAPGNASRRVTSAAPTTVNTENMMASENSGWPCRN